MPALFWGYSGKDMIFKSILFAVLIESSCKEECWAALKGSQAQTDGQSGKQVHALLIKKNQPKQKHSKQPPDSDKVHNHAFNLNNPFLFTQVLQNILKSFAGNWLCLVLSTSHSALGMDAQAELPESGAHLSKAGIVPRLASQPQSLNDVAKTTKLANGLTGFSPWIYRELYEPRQTQTVPKCPAVLGFALWIAICDSAK